MNPTSKKVPKSTFIQRATRKLQNMRTRNNGKLLRTGNMEEAGSESEGSNPIERAEYVRWVFFVYA